MEQEVAAAFFFRFLSVALPRVIFSGIKYIPSISKTRNKFTGSVFNLYNTVALKKIASASKIQEYTTHLK